ncbi:MULTISPECIES: undecaprenyl-diphosphate phosphatase [Lentibacter]|jgi:undecaprenyl-diphosphatase|uniref:Undecaprenyl-diphosphatase n=1 Tax=Lentibacter algarum TaxID=576131 RepID=A0A1H3MLT6_9RHOB|nr:undecaprenyl-diphosphate phosphatase [Lentibacter algarum]MCO4776582.1 undecaprenyl-diphosphate phosphatase [Lentibacter algarum]MCO4827711.1 undecaprenyl-diphosphate phosphatase [Lentibacter algarum]SDY77647.1 Undecaprenyl-diphosphatase [Lentibacter algarum]
MPFYLLILVALVQGITEFLPVSSSGHLILISELSSAPDQGQAIDVAVHIGTLFAVVIFFWRDVAMGLAGIPRMLTGRIDTAGSKLAFLLMIATIPAIAFGLVLKLTGLSDAMRSMTVIGWTMLLFGLLLWWADQRGTIEKTEADWTTRDAIKMGLWQAVALIPGTSRSGICITAGRMLGYSRQDSAKLAMLMSIPTIVASGVLLGVEVIATADAQVARDGAVAAVMSFVAALFALSIMMRLLRSISFTPYVIYRVALGIVLLVVAYSA